MTALSEKRLKEVSESIAWMMHLGIPVKSYDLESLAKIVDPSPMKRGKEAFIKKHQWWEDEDADV